MRRIRFIYNVNGVEFLNSLLKLVAPVITMLLMLSKAYSVVGFSKKKRLKVLKGCGY